MAADPTALTDMEFEEFQVGLESAFEDVDKEMRMRRRLQGLR